MQEMRGWKGENIFYAKQLWKKNKKLFHLEPGVTLKEANLVREQISQQETCKGNLVPDENLLPD